MPSFRIHHAAVFFTLRLFFHVNRIADCPFLFLSSSCCCLPHHLLERRIGCRPTVSARRNRVTHPRPITTDELLPVKPSRAIEVLLESKYVDDDMIIYSTDDHHQVTDAKFCCVFFPLADTQDDLSSQLEHATGLEDIKMAIEQLTLRSHGSRTSYSTSTYSSLSGSEGGAEPMRRLIRHSSLETINTNVTVADEFVWVDSYNRLVELQQLPWSNHDVLRVIQNGRIKEHLERVSMETVPRLSYLLQRALVRIARETQRLGRPLAMCSKQEVCSALRIVLSPALADSCIKVKINQSIRYLIQIIN